MAAAAKPKEPSFASEGSSSYIPRLSIPDSELTEAPENEVREEKQLTVIKPAPDQKALTDRAKTNSTENVKVLRPNPFKVSMNLPKGSKASRIGTFKGKSFRSTKNLSRTHSNGSMEAFDPDEDKLKMLPDCCEFTVRKKEGYEADESRKDMTSAWFQKINLSQNQQTRLCFSESLLLVEESGSIIGKTYCTVTHSKWNDKPCLSVHSGSFGKFSNNLESGTTITSFVNFNLKPIQELVHEWATCKSETIERKTLLISEGDLMPCKITTLRNGKLVDTKTINLGFGDQENLVTESTNILLQRHLILERRTNGTMNLQTLSYTGKVVKTKYGELGSGWENVRGKQIKTWGIRRHVTLDEEDWKWDSLFTKSARLILRCQPDSPQALIPLWFEPIIDFDKQGNFTGVYSPYSWACDMELYSKYSIKKDELTHDHRRYIMDHPEVRAMLSDYLQTILFRKPQDCIQYTKQYFEAFAALRRRSAKSASYMDSSSGSSTSYYGSSYSMMGELGEGEWYGEGEDGEPNLYKVNSTMDYEGLEKIDDANYSDGEPGGGTGNETEDDLFVNELGKYVQH